MHKLSDTFIAILQHGFLVGLLAQVVADKDLDLHFRNSYINIYYKGNSLLKLSETSSGYIVEVHEKFQRGLSLPHILTPETIDTFLSLLPHLKDNIVRYGQSSLEVEYEQLIIRANNLEVRNNTEYYILDRQYALGRDRFDLIGFYWPRDKRRRGQEVVPCFLEVKFALNTDIKAIHDQLERYYTTATTYASQFAEECQWMLSQKLELGLFKQSKERLEAMKTLRVSSDSQQFQFVIVLVDYNPHSTHLNIEKLQQLAFASQIKIFRSGFAMWHDILTPLTPI